LVLAYAALWPRRRIAVRAAAGALPFAALVLALCYLNLRQFGLFMPSAGYFLVSSQQPVLVYTPWIGGTGLFFDQTFGLVARTPIYLLAFVGLPALWSRFRGGHGPQVAALALPWLLSFLYIASIAYWYADGSPASRYMIGTLPFLVLCVAGGLEIVLRARWRDVAIGITVLLAAYSFLVTFAMAVLPEQRIDYAFDVREGATTRIWDMLGRAIRPDADVLFPSLIRIDPLNVVLALAWVALAAALVAAGARLRRLSPA
jgi:hypothetical protein